MVEEEEKIGRCFLVFSESNGGCFLTKWSFVSVEGALASFVPSDVVPGHRYTTNGGISELCRNVGGPNVKKFFGGWLSFIRMGMNYEGGFVFLGNVAKLPGASSCVVVVGVVVRVRLVADALLCTRSCDLRERRGHAGGECSRGRQPFV